MHGDGEMVLNMSRSRHRGAGRHTIPRPDVRERQDQSRLRARQQSNESQCMAADLAVFLLQSYSIPSVPGQNLQRMNRHELRVHRGIADLRMPEDLQPGR